MLLNKGLSVPKLEQYFPSELVLIDDYSGFLVDFYCGRFNLPDFWLSQIIEHLLPSCILVYNLILVWSTVQAFSLQLEMSHRTL